MARQGGIFSFKALSVRYLWAAGPGISTGIGNGSALFIQQRRCPIVM
jgi:hypothetical protein